ncbi:Eukaryotic translation initiation factor 3 subunit H [Acorus calamus]|uniref:Eukaryotic translation initiation factor 3 subunit H n=1 Tax=Acorus calamus TaxID=4465 RepID=A0AAV9BZT0_ACOCL|nr:Eukaryotic translation initiation factor 3 subunit H [Acorus calamus]
MARSFVQVAAAPGEVAQPLRVVQMEGLPRVVEQVHMLRNMAILKIIKHCKEFSPALVTGQLLGLDVGSVLEVTNCFPFPIREEDEELEADGANYQLEMMRCLREVNVDNNTVGWLREKNLSWVDIFEEIPIKVSNSALISAFMSELEADTPVTQCDYDRLQLSTNPFLERNVEFLIECMDDLAVEQQKFQFYYRNLSRQQTQQQTWLQQRRIDNNARKAAGEEPLPEEDPSNPIFKPIPEPSRLDSFLITNQISNYCNQINGVVGQSLSRSYLMKALHDN